MVEVGLAGELLHETAHELEVALARRGDDRLEARVQVLRRDLEGPLERGEGALVLAQLRADDAEEHPLAGVARHALQVELEVGLGVLEAAELARHARPVGARADVRLVEREGAREAPVSLLEGQAPLADHAPDEVGLDDVRTERHGPVRGPVGVLEPPGLEERPGAEGVQPRLYRGRGEPLVDRRERGARIPGRTREAGRGEREGPLDNVLALKGGLVDRVQHRAGFGRTSLVEGPSRTRDLGVHVFPPALEPLKGTLRRRSG